MKTLARFYGISKICALAGTLILCGTYAAEAGGFIYTPTQAALEAALAGGGTATFECNGTIVLTNTILISADTVLDGNGFNVTISGGNAVRIFQVAPGVSYWLKSLTLSDGTVIAPNGVDGSPPSPGQDALGGAILCQGGNLTLTDCTLSNNIAQGGHGGNDSNPPQFDGVSGAGGMGVGGAIYASGGTLNLTNCTLLSSVAFGGLGGFTNASPGAGGSAFGGAIYLSNVTATLAQVTCASNRLLSGAGQIGYGITIPTAGGNALGGAICVSNSTVLIANSRFFINSAIAANVTYVSEPGGGPGSGAGIGGCLFVSQGSTATIQTSSFSNNVAQGGSGFRYYPAGPAMGGAIASYGSLLLTDCSMSGNYILPGADISGRPGRGGGVYAEGPLTLNRCTFENNRAIGGLGGGVSSIPGYGGPGEGGGIWSSGTLMATNCTCATNLALGGDGFYNLGGPGSGGPGRGGAIFTSGGGTLVNLTLAYNRADSPSVHSPPGPAQGGGLAVTNATITARGTIIANSSNGGDVWGVVTDAGYNICSDGTGHFIATGSLNNTDPLLGPLANNGGPTQTMALQPSSPALDVIPSGFPPTDQRGVFRPRGPAADIGACEGGAVPPAPPNPPLLSTYLTNSWPPVRGGYIAVSFIGQSNVVYRLLSSSNLTSWSSIATNSTGPYDGLVTFNQLLSNGPAFYRVVTP